MSKAMKTLLIIGLVLVGAGLVVAGIRVAYVACSDAHSDRLRDLRAASAHSKCQEGNPNEIHDLFLSANGFHGKHYSILIATRRQNSLESQTRLSMM